MRKILLVVLIQLISINFIFAEKKFSFDITWSVLKPADTGYQKIYGEKLFYPEMILSGKVYRDIFLYIGFGFLKEEGISGHAEVKDKSDQNFLSIGAGYEFFPKKRLSLKLSGGISFINYEGTAYISDGKTGYDEGSRIGYKFDIGVFYKFSKTYTANFIIGYFHGQNTEDFARKLSYGGLKIGAGVGVLF